MPDVQRPGLQDQVISDADEGGLKEILGEHSSQATPDFLAPSQAVSTQPTPPSKATTVQPEQLTLPAFEERMNKLYAPSLAETISTVASSYAGEDLRVDVPSRPRGDGGRELEQFECPYCLITQYISNDRRWKKHVFEDLQPYVCTYGDCNTYDQFFESRDAWFTHELQHHRTKWFCNFDKHPEHDSEENFLSHMNVVHNQNFEGEQFSLVKGMFRRPRKNLAGTCNLCGRDSKRLKSHVSRHLQQMAMFALPRANDTKGSYKTGCDSRSSRSDLTTWENSSDDHPTDEDSTFEDSDDEKKYPDTIKCKSATQLVKRLRRTHKKPVQ